MHSKGNAAPGAVTVTAPQSEHDEPATLKALLSLAASGVAADVIDGTADEQAAVHLGRLLGREPGEVVLTCRGQEAVYRWPNDWQHLVHDYARAAALGSAEVRRQASDIAGGVR